MTDVSIIVVNHNTRELLRACLESVCRRPQGVTAEVLVIDNASTDGSAEMVNSEFPEVRLSINRTNEGFARPNNEGMRMAAGRYVLLLNSDAEVVEDAVAKLVAFLDQHPDAGACGPMLVYPDGRLQRSAKGFPTLWSRTCDMFFLDKVFPRSRLFGRAEMASFSYQETAEVDHLMAAAFLVRREVLDTVGVLDERFKFYYNDMDWCYRIKQAGWKIYFVHTARIIHHLGSTVIYLNRDFQYFEELHNNTMLFYQKHYGRRSIVMFKLLLCAGFLMRSAGWGLVCLARPSPRAVMMSRFSRKTLALGMRFWKPLPYEDVPDSTMALLE